MRNLEKSHKRDADDSSTIDCLPDEIILQILNRLIDLKTLCFCYLVSRRFSSIVLQVGAISFTASPLSPRIAGKNTVGDVDGRSWLYGEPFLSALRFLSKFKRVKSLSIELPSCSHTAVDNSCLFKWKVKFGHRIESFIFLSPSSIFDKDESYPNGNALEDEDEQQLISDMFKQNFDLSFECLTDVLVWRKILLQFVKDLPLLEEVCITDSGRRGRLALSGEKLNEVKKWVSLASETEVNHGEVPDVVSNGYISILKLPVSGLVMRGIYCGVTEMKDIQGGYDFLKKSENGFEDKQEAVFTEAMMEILENHRGMMLTFANGVLV